LQRNVKFKTIKKIVIILFINLLLTSCSPNDDIVKEEGVNRGFIEMEYNGEKLSFGKNAYNGWLLNDQKDTIARLYTARITKDEQNFYDIRLFAYISKEKQLNALEMEFNQMVNGEGWTYQYTTEENTMVYKNTEFDGLSLKSNFEGYLFYHPTEDKKPVHLTNGKINIFLKRLEIDWSQW